MFREWSLEQRDYIIGSLIAIRFCYVILKHGCCSLFVQMQIQTDFVATERREGLEKTWGAQYIVTIERMMFLPLLLLTWSLFSVSHASLTAKGSVFVEQNSNDSKHDNRIIDKHGVIRVPIVRNKDAAVYGSIEDHIPAFSMSDPQQYSYPNGYGMSRDIPNMHEYGMSRDIPNNDEYGVQRDIPNMGEYGVQRDIPNMGEYGMQPDTPIIDEQYEPHYQRYATYGNPVESQDMAIGRGDVTFMGGTEVPYQEGAPDGMELGPYANDQVPVSDTLLSPYQYARMQEPLVNHFGETPADMMSPSYGVSPMDYKMNEFASSTLSPKKYVYHPQLRLPSHVLKKYLKRLIEKVGPTLSWQQAVAAFGPKLNSIVKKLQKAQGGIPPAHKAATVLTGNSVMKVRKKPKINAKEDGKKYADLRRLMHSKVKTAEVTSELTAEAKTLVKILREFRKRLQHNSLVNGNRKYPMQAGGRWSKAVTSRVGTASSRHEILLQVLQSTQHRNRAKQAQAAMSKVAAALKKLEIGRLSSSGAWSSCSRSCGGGVRIRRRPCQGSTPRKICAMKMTKYEACNYHPCPLE